MHCCDGINNDIYLISEINKEYFNNEFMKKEFENENIYDIKIIPT